MRLSISSEEWKAAALSSQVLAKAARRRRFSGRNPPGQPSISTQRNGSTTPQSGGVSTACRLGGVAWVGRGRHDERLVPAENRPGLRVTDTAGRLAIDAPVRKGFAEVNRDFPGGVCRRNESKIAKGDAPEINEEYIRTQRSLFSRAVPQRDAPARRKRPTWPPASWRQGPPQLPTRAKIFSIPATCRAFSYYILKIRRPWLKVVTPSHKHCPCRTLLCQPFKTCRNCFMAGERALSFL